MGKVLRAQRLGKGSTAYAVIPSGTKYQPSYKTEKGTVVDLVHDVGRDAPIAKISYPSGVDYLVAPIGVKVGDTTDKFVSTLGEIPESTPVCSIETYPNSGPKLCMSPGNSGMILSKTEKSCIVQLPSKKTRVFNLNCRATMGIPAGDGRSERPWTKAGKKWIAFHARGKRYPTTSGKAMNAVSHPFGSGYGGGVGRPKTVSRNAPPGRKVGSIAASRTGKRKNK